MREIVANKSALMILLNEALHLNKQRFEVKYPVNGMTLFSLDLERREVGSIVSWDKFENHRRRFKSKSDFIKRDQPKYGDLKECLISSGVLPYSNIAELEASLMELESGSQDRFRNPKPTLISVDTNLLYLRLLTRIFPLKGKNGAIDASRFKFVLSQIVREEITGHVLSKYKPHQIHQLQAASHEKAILKEFSNACTRRTRNALNAQTEYDLIIDEFNAFTAESERFEEDKEKRDVQIAESLADFSRQKDANVLLLTADDNMRVHARNFRLSSELIVLPHEVPRQLHADQWKMADLLYDLTLHFGLVRLSGLGIILLGEWRGKNVQDFLDESVKIVIEKGSSIGDQLLRDVGLVDSWRTIEGKVSRL